MNSVSRLRAWLQGEMAPLVGLALLKLLLHLLTSFQYGYFRDEFYYLAASKRLAFGYVDFPPFIALLTAFVRHVLGESLVALHLFPAIAGALVVFLAGWMARDLGASRSSQRIAALAVLVAPAFLGANSLLTMDSFDQLWWVLCAALLIRIFRDDNPRLWPWFGLVAGIGLATKLSMLYFGLAVAIGLALTPGRRYFRSAWLYLGGGIALVFLLPYIAWNALNGWPTLGFWANYAEKVYRASPLEFLLQQVLLANPLALPLWLAGLAYTFTEKGKPYRPLGWVYIILLAVFMLQNAKNYFLAPVYPLLFALGSVGLHHFISARGRWSWVRPSVAALVMSGLLVAPLTLPLLPVDLLARGLAALGGVNVQSEKYDSGVLPQYFADRFGWPEMTATVTAAYRQLPAADRAQACLFTGNYGEAGALEFLGRDLPPVISGHNNYALWGPGTCSGEVLLFIGNQEDQDDLQGLFAEVTPVAEIDCRYCMPYEADSVVFLCRHILYPLDQIWQQASHFE